MSYVLSKKEPIPTAKIINAIPANAQKISNPINNNLVVSYLLASKNALAKPCGVMARLACLSIFPNCSG